MQFVSTGSNYTAHMKLLIEQRQGLALRALVRLFLANKYLNLPGQEPTNGRATACGENPYLLQRLPGQANGHVLL
jgi:hypothetical protein